MCQCVGGLEPYFIYVNDLHQSTFQHNIRGALFQMRRCNVESRLMRADDHERKQKYEHLIAIFLDKTRHPHSHPSFSRTHYYFKHFLRYWMNELLVRVFRPENSFSFYNLSQSVKFCAFFLNFCLNYPGETLIPPHSQLQTGTTKHSSLLHLHCVNTKQSR